MSLVVVGTMAFDTIETPFGKTEKIIGGSATYAAYTASNFIKPIQQVSIIGYDFLRPGRGTAADRFGSRAVTQRESRTRRGLGSAACRGSPAAMNCVAGTSRMGRNVCCATPCETEPGGNGNLELGCAPRTMSPALY